MEKVLPCGCHKINDRGELFSRIVQYSVKGKQGIQTEKSNQWKKLSCTITNKGYVQCNIHGRIIRVNRLVANNFIENPLCYGEVHHANDVKTDNRVENLRWGNAKMNAKDRDRNGNTTRGVKNANAKLNGRSVVEIRERLAAGESLMSIARGFGVSKKLILLIKQNKIWRHI